MVLENSTGLYYFGKHIRPTYSVDLKKTNCHLFNEILILNNEINATQVFLGTAPYTVWKNSAKRVNRENKYTKSCREKLIAVMRE